MADLTIGKLVRAKAAGSIVGGLARQEMESSAYGDAEIAAALAAVALNTDKRSYPEVDEAALTAVIAAAALNTGKRTFPEEKEAKLDALPTRAELTAEIEAVEGGPGMDFDAATNLATAETLAWGTHYLADIAANVTIASFTGTPANGSRLEWSGVVTGQRAFSFPESRRVNAEGTLTSVTLRAGLNRMIWEYLDGEIHLVDTGYADLPAGDVKLAHTPANYSAAGNSLEQHVAGLDSALAAITGGLPFFSGSAMPGYTVPGVYASTATGDVWLRTSASNRFVLATGAYVAGSNPTLDTAAIATSGESITLGLSEAVSQGAAFDAAHMRITGSISGELSLSGFSGWGTDTLTASIGGTIDDTELVTLDWDGTVNGIENSAGDDLETITDFEITNNSTADVLTIQALSAAVAANGETLTLTLNRAGDFDVASAGFSVVGSQGNGGAATYASARNTINPVFTLATPLVDGETATLSYDAATGDWEGSNNLPLATFSGLAVTNASTVPGSSDNGPFGNLDTPYDSSTYFDDSIPSAYLVAYKVDLGALKSGAVTDFIFRGYNFHTSGNEFAAMVWSHDSENDTPSTLLSRLRTWDAEYSGSNNINLASVAGDSSIGLDGHGIVWLAVGTENSPSFNSRIMYDAGSSERAILLLAGSAADFVSAVNSPVGKTWSSYTNAGSATVFTDRKPCMQFTVSPS